MSGVTLVTATIAGRLSTHMPVRWLIGPGLFLVGIGLLLMTGLDGASTWTHLIPGFIVAGAGSGMVNPPLASTAVGVVTPQRSGMASGVNTTFRQIGIATGIAAYGSIFASSLHHKMDQALAGTPSLHEPPAPVVAAVQQGDAAQAIGAVPPSLRGPLVAAIHSSFASTLDVLLVVSAALALVGAACSAGPHPVAGLRGPQQPQPRRGGGMDQALGGTPTLHRLLPGVVTDIQQGDGARAIRTVPEALRGTLVAAIHSSFADTLDLLLVVSAALALAGAVCASP